MLVEMLLNMLLLVEMLLNMLLEVLFEMLLVSGKLASGNLNLFNLHHTYTFL